MIPLILTPIPMCVFFPYHQAILQQQLRVLEFSSIQFNADTIYREIPSDPMGSGFSPMTSPRPHHTHTHQMPNASPRCHLGFRPTSYRLEVPTTPSLGSVNLLERLTALREPFYLLDHRFITKGHNSGPEGKRHRARCGGQGRASTLCEQALLPAPAHVQQPRNSEPHLLGVLWWFHYDWFKSWATDDWTSKLLSDLRGQWDGTESFNPLINWLISLAASPQP